jgi:hypothetical protein
VIQNARIGLRSESVPKGTLSMLPTA